MTQQERNSFTDILQSVAPQFFTINYGEPGLRFILTSVPETQQKTFYIETFGCQMNVHDSEKVIGTLLQQGYLQVETVEQADLVLHM